MTVTRMWKVHGYDGHRQALSFGESVRYDWSNRVQGIRVLTLLCSDRIDTNYYVVVIITRNTAGDCKKELRGQLSDGLFENYRYGTVEEITEWDEIQAYLDIERRL